MRARHGGKAVAESGGSNMPWREGRRWAESGEWEGRSGAAAACSGAEWAGRGADEERNGRGVEGGAEGAGREGGGA